MSPGGDCAADRWGMGTGRGSEAVRGAVGRRGVQRPAVGAGRAPARGGLRGRLVQPLLRGGRVDGREDAVGMGLVARAGWDGHGARGLGEWRAGGPLAAHTGRAVD